MTKISIHAPLTGSDCIHFCPDTTNPQFQSTLPLRGATGTVNHDIISTRFQSTLPLRGATRGCPCFLEVVMISIHAPLTGSDVERLCQELGLENFNPRSPYGERPASGYNLVVNDIFQSTLPLRGATVQGFPFDYRHQNFNPRSPYGERLPTH